MQTLTQKITLNCKGRLLNLETPVVMGIINTTPDSFFEGSRKNSIDAVLQQADAMITAGATMLDIGGYSTRPGALEVSLSEELSRTIPFIEAISKQFPSVFLSIDTFRAQVAKEAIEAGAHIINDVSAGDDDVMMFETVKELGVPYIIMHKKGNPGTMQHLANYENVVLEVLDYLAAKVQTLRNMQVKDIVIDPGFGFAKNLQHNYQLLQHLKDLQILGLPILVGVSRKKMIQSVLGTDAHGALNGTTVINTIGLLNGAKILRVHDVKEAVECVKLVNAVYGVI